MSQQPVISIQGVSKAYRIWESPGARLMAPTMEFLAKIVPGAMGRSLKNSASRSYSDFWALRDISFEVNKGEAVGIIGRNGSGKSTLLQIICGTLNPSSGTVRVSGRVAALLELGSGFNPEFTGRENVFLNGAVLGLSRKEIEERFDRIATFADIGGFIDQPTKTYSSGMLVRLAFSVQVAIDPDILVIDEALAVGDTLFQKRCYEQMHRLIEKGTTILFVSHSEESVRTLTSRALLLKAGQSRAYGPSAETILEYRRILQQEEQSYLNHVNKSTNHSAVPTPEAKSTFVHDPLSFGALTAEVLNVVILDEENQAKNYFYPGDLIQIRVDGRCHTATDCLNVNLRIRNKEGIKIYSWGTLNQDLQIKNGHKPGKPFWERSFAAGNEFSVYFNCRCTLGANFYEVQASITKEGDLYYGNQEVLHWRDEAAFFTVALLKHEYFFGGVSDLQMVATY